MQVEQMIAGYKVCVTSPGALLAQMGSSMALTLLNEVTRYCLTSGLRETVLTSQARK